MKKFSKLITESDGKKTIKLKNKPVNYLTSEEIEKYLEIAKKFLDNDSLFVCNWLIENNEYYKKNINSLVTFYNDGYPNNDNNDLKKLYSAINRKNNDGRVKEIPVFMTRAEFDNVINKKIPADKAIMDFNSEEGRNEIAKRYISLVHKIVNSWIGKTSLNRDDLFEAGMHGLADAMKDYGEKSDKAKKTNKDINLDKYMTYTFLQFAAQRIRIMILEVIKDQSHLVRIPRSKQAKEKEDKGFIAKSNSVSGETPIDGDEGKAIFDLVGDNNNNPILDIDKKILDKYWDEILTELTDHFGEKTMDIFKNYFGFGLENGKKKLSGKEMAKKYGYNSPSSITAEVTKVILYIKKNKKMYDKFCEISLLTREMKHDEDECINDNEPIYTSTYRMMKDKSGIYDDIDLND